MTKAAYVAVTVGVGAMVLLTIAPTVRRRIAGSMRCCGYARPISCSNGWCDCATWRCKDGCGFTWAPAAESSTRLACRRGPSSAASSPGQHGCLPSCGCSRSFQAFQAARQLRRVLVIEIRPAVQRAGHLPDGAVAGLGRGLFPGARRPAGHLRQRACGDVVGDGDLTTVGYGDVVPITPLGRMVAALVMMSVSACSGCGPAFSRPVLPRRRGATTS